MALSENHIRLINGWQRGFPLEPEPFARIAIGLGVSELTVLGMLKQLAREGVLSRVGAVVAPNTAGASTLAAMAVPDERMEEVAAAVSAEPGVNHNYEREHRYNLWFVVTGASRRAIDGSLRRIRRGTGLAVLDLPLRTAYHIDLGFPIDGPRVPPQRGLPIPVGGHRPAPSLSPRERALLHAIEDGMPIVPRPYAEVARRTGQSEEAVIETLRRLTGTGIIKRLGLVVRHRELGFLANAMVVWDLPDDRVDALGTSFARVPFVTLCYRRDRRPPDWPYNLFCMIHGRDRATVLAQVEELRRLAGAGSGQMAVLFSLRRFKQNGARLSAA